VFSGVLEYFPDAIAAVAKLSKEGNDKHNPDQPLHWAREKSNDHEDCIARHLMDHDWVELAWRALAQLQLMEEKRKQDEWANLNPPVVGTSADKPLAAKRTTLFRKVQALIRTGALSQGAVYHAEEETAISYRIHDLAGVELGWYPKRIFIPYTGD
jgi:hypothetical protein